MATAAAPAASPTTISDEGGEEQVDHVGVAADRAAVVGEGDDDEHDAAEPGPEPGGGEAREGQRPGAELQRHDGHGDAEQQRHERRRTRARRGSRRTAGRSRPASSSVPSPSMRSSAEQHAEHARRPRARAARPDEQPPDHLVVARRQPAPRPTAPTRRAAVEPSACRRCRTWRCRVQGSCRWCWSSVVRFGRDSTRRASVAGGHYRSARRAGRNRRSTPSRQDEDVDRQRGEQQRDVGDAEREHASCCAAGVGLPGEGDRAGEEHRRRARRRSSV